MKKNHRYSFSVMALHWLVGAGIFTAFGVGLYMVDLPGITPFKLRLFNWHKWLGVSLFVLVLLRIGVRMFTKTPAYPAHWKPKTVVMAKAGHVALYILMLAVPTFGYLYSLASGFPVVWFGVIELPILIDKTPLLKDLFKILHEVSAKGLIFLAAGHVLMALKHHIVDKDGILGRMIPGMKVNE